MNKDCYEKKQDNSYFAGLLWDFSYGCTHSFGDRQAVITPKSVIDSLWALE